MIERHVGEGGGLNFVDHTTEEIGNVQFAIFIFTKSSDALISIGQFHGNP